MKTALWILAILGLALFLREASALCVPVTIAGLLSFALAPVVRVLACGALPALGATILTGPEGRHGRSLLHGVRTKCQG